MFRRLWTGLPADAEFPPGLNGLGYFINGEDEIRSIEEPDYYFKFFLNRNPRINMRQRFEFNRALECVIHERIEGEDLVKRRLPIGAQAWEPHVPIFTSRDLSDKSRVVVIFGEPTQDLGLLAGRVANGAGGIDKGSMVSVIRALKTQKTSAIDPSPPGIVLANTGQLYWWPEGSRAITISASAALPLPSLVHTGWKYAPSVNSIAGHENPSRHTVSLFSELFSKLHDTAKIDIVAIGQACELVERFLDDATNWTTWGGKLSSMVLINPVYPAEFLKNDLFKEFLAKRTRGYVLPPGSEPVNTPLAPPTGNAKLTIPALGYPCYASSEPHHTEMILVRDFYTILAYSEEVALSENYENDHVVATGAQEEDEEDEEETVTDEDLGEFEDRWNSLQEEQRPNINVVSSEEMERQRRQLRKWEQFEKTREAMGSSSGEELGGN